MLDYSEKRDFPRMAVNCAARFRVVGKQETGTAIVKDLSGGGLLLWTDDEVASGDLLNVEVMPGKSITPPLHAVVEVIRCDALSGEEAAFSVACTLEKMLDTDEAGPDFP
jgi:hypothetical protein